MVTLPFRLWNSRCISFHSTHHVAVPSVRQVFKHCCWNKIMILSLIIEFLLTQSYKNVHFLDITTGVNIKSFPQPPSRFSGLSSTTLTVLLVSLLYFDYLDCTSSISTVLRLPRLYFDYLDCSSNSSVLRLPRPYFYYLDCTSTTSTVLRLPQLYFDHVDYISTTSTFLRPS